MPYRLMSNETVEAGIQRIVIEQIDGAQHDLAARDHSEAIHQFRKRCKKIRGVLRLVRPAFGESRFKKENARYRDIARSVSGVRDAQVLIETFDKLLTIYNHDLDRRHFSPMRARLIACREETLDSDLQQRLSQLGDALSSARGHVKGWQLKKTGFAAVNGGLRKTYQGGGETMGVAYQTSSTPAFHQWRKCTKYHGYHCRLLRDIWPPLIEARTEQLDRLSDLLGDEHDLADLHASLTNPATGFEHHRHVSRLIELIERRRHELRVAALPIGRRLFNEKAKALSTRLAIYWDVWNAPTAS